MWVQAAADGSPVWWLGEGLTTPNRGWTACFQMLHWALELDASGSEYAPVEGGKFLDWMGDCWLNKKDDSAPTVFVFQLSHLIFTTM